MSQLIYESHSPKGIVKNKIIGNSSCTVLKEADKLGVAWRILPCTQLIELSYDGKKRTYYHQVPHSTSALAIYACNNKGVTTNLLLNGNISVPKGYKIKKTSSDEYLLSVYENLQKPLVVKPSDGTWGENITVGIVDFDEYREAVDLAFDYTAKESSTVIVEEMFKGTEYRILATRNKVDIRLFSVIYKLIDDARESMESILAPEIVESEIGTLVIKGVFRTLKNESIVGGEVLSGKIMPGLLVRLKRGDELLAEAEVEKVQRQKQEAKEVFEGEMCGLSLKTDKKVLLQEGDTAEFFTRELKKRTLSS